MSSIARPGRLGDPSMNIGTDPRTDPRLLAAMAPFGIDQHAQEGPVTFESPYADLLEYQTAGEAGFGGLMQAIYAGLPPIQGVDSSTTTIEGVDGNAITLHIHRPSDLVVPVPGILQLHGGGMSIGGAEDPQFTRYRQELAAAGAVVVGVEFRNSAGALGPYPFPAGLDDCTAALRWMDANRDSLGITKIVISGESGGANLSLATVLRAKRDGEIELIDGVYVQCPYISGTYAEQPDELPSLTENQGYFLSVTTMSVTAAVYDPSGEHRTNPLAWPYYASIDDLSGLPPHTISVNEIDPLRDEGLAYHRKLVAAGTSSVCKTVAGTTHGADLIFAAALPDLHAAAVRDVVSFAGSL